MEKFKFKEYIRSVISEELEEGGYWGQGTDTQGAASFHGTYYGFGGDKQLATEPDPSVKKLKKQRDLEATQNIEDQMKINGGYPAPESSSGFPGGESRSGVRSGARIPNTLAQIAFPATELDILDINNPTKQFWGFHDLDEEESPKDLEEQLSGPAARAVPSDANYRDVMGFPRHNSVVKSVDFVPEIEGDKDGDGEEDVYLSDEEYVNDVLRLNGISVKPGQLKRVMMGDIIESSVSEAMSYVSPSYDPEPDKGIERYKQGRWLDTPTADTDPTKYIMNFVDHSGGHANMHAAKDSPGAQTYGQIGAPKNFVPDDWEQRSPQTKVDDEAPDAESDLKEIIQTIVDEILVVEKSKTHQEAYTGLNDETGQGAPKGGSSAFEKNRKQIIAFDKKYRPRGPEDFGEE